MKESAKCDAVIAQFVFGAEKCGKPSVTTVKCEQWPHCPKDHPVCEDHSHPMERSKDD